MGVPLRRGLLCFVRHIKMYFRIHFCICVYQRIQFCFSALRFSLKKCIFLLARVLHIAVCPKKSRTKKLNQGESLCSHYHSSSAASPPSTTSSNTSTATNNKTSKEARHVHHPRILRHRHHRLNAIPPTRSFHIYLQNTNPRCNARRGFFCFRWDGATFYLFANPYCKKRAIILY